MPVFSAPRSVELYLPCRPHLAHLPTPVLEFIYLHLLFRSRSWIDLYKYFTLSYFWMSISQTRNGTSFVHGAAKCHSNNYKYPSLGCVSEAETLHVDRALDVTVQLRRRSSDRFASHKYTHSAEILNVRVENEGPRGDQVIIYVGSRTCHKVFPMPFSAGSRA